MQRIGFSLVFEGKEADENRLDFYDAAAALTGFQRSLALTTHLILNGEIIVQAPYLKGADIYLHVPEHGSWKARATVVAVASGIYMLGTAPRDTVIGNLIISAYDYVVSESLGFHVDFDKTLGQQYEELQRKRGREAPIPKPTQSKMDALIEKCEQSIKEMHRPIYASKTADTAVVEYKYRRKTSESRKLSLNTYEYVSISELDDVPTEFVGKISSYNVNTYKGRIFTKSDQRPVPFILMDSVRTLPHIALITRSLDANAARRMDGSADVKFFAFRNLSVTGRLKNLVVTEVLPA